MKQHYLKTLHFIFCLVISFTITAQTSQYFTKKLLEAEGLGTNKINDVAQDDDGFLWIATSNGLNRFDGTELVKFYHQENINSIPHNYVYCLKMLPGNILAIGTQAGLSFYDVLTGTFTNFYYRLNNTLDEDNNAIVNLETDGNQHCWAYSRNCIYIFDSLLLVEKIISSPYPRPDTIKKRPGFTEKIFPSSEGKVLLYSVNCDSTGAQKTMIAAVKVNGKYSSNLASPINFSSKQNDITIHQHSTQTSWFYALLIPAIAIAFYCMYSYHTTQLKRTELIRSEISRNLHDEVGSTLTNISLGSLLAQKQLAKDSPVIRILDRIYQDSQNVSQTMREIIWSINPRVDTLSEALPRMLHYASELLEAKNIELEAEIGPGIEHVKLSMYKRRDLYLIFKEAVNNLSKHSNADQVKFSIQLIRHTLTMTISDNGTGFDQAFDAGCNGLKNMKERARTHHWQLAVQSLPGFGTTVGLKAQIA
jgi:signal transduction histidine kinase